jgi:NAD-dependent protein deacetylase/lipoamidase
MPLPKEAASDDGIRRAAELLARASSVAVLTGAGVSAESGVPTFRASDGLWEGHRIEDVASPMGFRRDPKLVWNFYNARRANVGKVRPNPGHYALVELEKRWGERFTLITQNVDGLHRTAGSRRVLEVHGSLYRTRCTACDRIEDRGLEPLGELPHCPHCSAMLRPDIVWFHEPLPEDVWQEAVEAVAGCDVLLVVGTSAVVYPAASLIPLAKHRSKWDDARAGAAVVEVNLARTDASDLVDVGLYGKSGEILPKVVALLFRS